MYYIKNIEDDKLEIHFSKAEYLAMPEDHKKLIKSSCLFSGSRSCWRSRSKIQSAWHIENKLKEWGFEDKGTEGEKLSFAEKVEREQDKAADRADRMDIRHDKAVKESESTFHHAHEMIQCIPMGQPILVGHHSERGHRALLEKHDNAMRKGFELDEKAEYYRTRYNNALHTSEGSKYKNAGYLVNRVKECETRLRECARGLQGKFYVYSQPQEISEERKVYWNEQIEETTDKLNYMTYCLKQIKEESGLFDKESLKGKTEVKINGRWQELVRANPTTVSMAKDALY